MSPQISIAPGPVANTAPRARHKVLQYELNVVASGAADLVSRIGGWLFDRRMAGWRVSVALAEPDDRALRILGLKTVELKELWQSTAPGSERLAMTAIATDRFNADDEVRLRGLTALRHSAGNVAFWGAGQPDQLGEPMRRAQYRLSAAACAFKAHALAAAGLPESVDAFENLYRCGHFAGTLDYDLVPY